MEPTQIFHQLLDELKAVGVIPIISEHLHLYFGRVAMIEFESWLKALKEGRPDHREWIFKEEQAKARGPLGLQAYDRLR